MSTTFPTPSRTPSIPLNISDTYSLSSTNSDPFPTSTKSDATANPCKTLYQPHFLT